MKIDFCSCLASAIGLASLSAHAREDLTPTWIERPWEFRYIIQIADPSSFVFQKKTSQDNYLRKGKLEIPYPTMVVSDFGTITFGAERYPLPISILAMRFNPKGELISPHNWPKPLFGRISTSRYVYLASNSDPQDVKFRIDQWYTGISGNEIDYIPAVCSDDDMNLRYKIGYKTIDTIAGNFGCREWGHYLKSNQYPYIDITSYEWEVDDSISTKKNIKKPTILKSHIRPITGWGRFDISPKPIIGKNENIWVCIYECPDDENPGVIPDIKVWAAKHGWPEPSPPNKMPLFPDHPVRPGEFVD